MVHNSLDCPICNALVSDVFIELLNLPIYCNLLWSDQQAARDCPKGDIKLAFCDQCGAIFNTAFDPAKLGYSQDYENSLHYSSRFQSYIEDLAQRLVSEHHLQNKTILEIGCGKGDFLVLLCELGNNSGVGFDNSYVERAEHKALSGQIEFIKDFYSERYADYPADFVCCRQVLEHIQKPDDLLRPLRQTLKDRPATDVFFEVPNALYTIGNLMIWDIIYEHCTYFTPVSLRYAFEAAGYEVGPIKEEFAGQFLSIGAKAGKVGRSLTVDKNAIAQLTADIAHFEERFHAHTQQWKARLSKLSQQGKKAVVWGSGSKGVTFLNLLASDSNIEYAVDINPRKQGKFIPGTGQAIVPPERMAHYQPDVVIVMNPLYKQEIADSLQAMGLTPTIVGV